jgi:hypothetical protein
VGACDHGKIIFKGRLTNKINDFWIEVNMIERNGRTAPIFYLAKIMKTASLFKPVNWLIVFLVISNSACVQPYSRKSFYKESNRNATGIDENNTRYPSASNESGLSLTYPEIVGIMNAREQSEAKLTARLQRFDPHWRIKGFDINTGELFLFNFSSKDNKEAFIWHRKEMTAEYVTLNPYHCLALIRDIKAKGYKFIRHTDDKGAVFSNGETDVLIAPVELKDNSSGYKFVVTPNKP